MVQTISSLGDGSSNTAIIVQEAVLVRYLDINPIGLNQVKISTNFVSIEDGSANARL